MRYGRSLIPCFCLVLGSSCGFDASGVGDTTLGDESESDGGPGDGDPGDGDPGDGDGDPGDGDGDPGDGDGDSGDGDGDSGDGDGDSGDGDGDSGDGDGDSGDGDGDSGDGDGDADPCAGYEFQELMLASDGQTVAPMAIYGNVNEGQGIYAQSELAEQGSITWTFELECPVEVVIWGVVWDLSPGAHADDADSFWVRVDAEIPEWKWVYGCQTDNAPTSWTYQEMSHNAGADSCMVESLSWNLGAGVHELRLRNREGSDFQGAAAVARVLVTSDLNYVPTLQAD